MYFARTWIVMIVVLVVVTASAVSAEKGPVKVFILAGQSNMEGHARTATLDYLGEAPKNGKLVSKVKKDDG